MDIAHSEGISYERSFLETKGISADGNKVQCVHLPNRLPIRGLHYAV
jgi:hypothetical protein